MRERLDALTAARAMPRIHTDHLIAVLALGILIELCRSRLNLRGRGKAQVIADRNIADRDPFRDRDRRTRRRRDRRRAVSAA